MAYYEIQPLSGRLTIALYRLDGQLLQRVTEPNLITKAGKALIAQLFIGSVEGKADLRIAVGDSNNTVNIDDTELGRQLDESPAAVSVIDTVTVEGVQRASVKLIANFPALPAGKTQVLREAGVVMRFSNQPQVLYNHVNFAEITRTDNVQMTLTWEVLF